MYGKFAVSFKHEFNNNFVNVFNRNQKIQLLKKISYTKNIFQFIC